MNAAICIKDCRVTPDGRIVLTTHIGTQTGFSLDTDIEVTVASSNTQMTASIINQAKAILRDQGQAVSDTQDNFKVFGGVS